MSDASRNGARVLVIGAQGVLGRLCVEALSEAGLSVIRAGRRDEGAADFRCVDVADAEAVADACADADLVISTVRHPAQLVERHVLRHGGALLNIATLWAVERESLRSHAADAHGLVVLDAGLSPGVTSLVLKEMLASHPEADGIEIAATFSAFEPSGRATAIDFLYPALTSRRRHEVRAVDFPSPIGRRKCLRLTGSDVDAMLFGGLQDGRKTYAYGCMLERAVNADFLALNAAGLLSRMPVGFFTAGSKWKMRRRTEKAQAHILAVTRSGTRLAAGAVEGSGNYLMTAAAIVGYAESLLDRRGSRPLPTGVVGVEDVFELNEMRANFEQRGITIRSLPT